METTQEAVDKLAALVMPHEWLAKNGYKGQRIAAGNCVVANYLHDKTSHEHVVCEDRIIDMSTCTGVSVPDRVKQLIVGFDHGDYPELVAP